MDEPPAQEHSVDVLGYLAGLRRYWLVGLIAFVLVVIPGALWARNASVSYAATIQVLVQPGNVKTEAQAVQQQAMIEYLMRSYTAADDNPAVVDQVATQLSLPASQVAASTSISWPGDSLLLEIKASAASPQAAVALANAYAAALAEHGPQLLPAPSDAFTPQLAVVDGPVTSTASGTGSARRVVLVVFVAGLVAFAAMALADGVAAARRREE